MQQKLSPWLVWKWWFEHDCDRGNYLELKDTGKETEEETGGLMERKIRIQQYNGVLSISTSVL